MLSSQDTVYNIILAVDKSTTIDVTNPAVDGSPLRCQRQYQPLIHEKTN